MIYICPRCVAHIQKSTLLAKFSIDGEIEKVTGECPKHGKMVITKYDPDDFPTPIACDIDDFME